jgi:hypothetical protein
MHWRFRRKDATTLRATDAMDAARFAPNASRLFALLAGNQTNQTNERGRQSKEFVAHFPRLSLISRVTMLTDHRICSYHPLAC